jgi:hypothetical protein
MLYMRYILKLSSYCGSQRARSQANHSLRGRFRPPSFFTRTLISSVGAVSDASEAAVLKHFSVLSDPFTPKGEDAYGPVFYRSTNKELEN